MLLNILPSALVSIMPMSGVDSAQIDQLASTSKRVAIEYISTLKESETYILKELLVPFEQARLARIFPKNLQVCYRDGRRNTPASDASQNIKDYKQTFKITSKVRLASAPVAQGCLMSGYGFRGTSRRAYLHKGWDIAFSEPVDVYAGGDGTIIEAHYRGDYGNMILIDHGDGVFTRYAHLENFAPEISIGTPIKAGQTIGRMGTSADKPVARHLHYEILIGDYNTPKQSFGLKPIDVTAPLPKVSEALESS
ncbi:M23 family metallopeptidase [Hirschia litorea]|uniref:M23 family metallopeptidase n=1 Tax=Hirschia litorea TaxID=1199156 RepID=A0ABW2IGL9_9PROT